MKTKLSILTLLVMILVPASVLSQARKTSTRGTNPEVSPLPPINYTEYRLPNGLRVIFHQDRSTPIVAVNVWYHVGSKNESPGKTGFAHLFEHMMFQGSKHYDNDFFVPLQEAGGTLNGSTNADRTNYWEVVPSNFLELALWLESDRMGHLLDAMTEEKLANQRDVVKNEKRQNYDNRPYGLVSARIAETMFPKNHPYHWLTIGSLDDLTAASMDDVKDFFRRFYTPNNASLVIAGDFDPAEARRLVQKYFGPISKGPDVKRMESSQPRLNQEIRIQMDDRVSLPRIYITWHSAPQYSKDDAALDTLATVLATGKSSRLYKSLVYEKQIAQDVSASHFSREIAGQFQIVATAKPGKSLKELEAAINEELGKLKIQPPTADEIERAFNGREASFTYSLQTVGGFGGKSDQLNRYAVFLNNPGYFQQDLARYRNVTAAEVQRMANTYLDSRRLVLTVTPRPRGKTTGDPVPLGPTGAAVPPSEQTAETSPQPATSKPTGTKPAAERPAEVTRAEAEATIPAGAAPQTAEAKKGPEVHQDKSKLGGLYVQPKPKADPKFQLPQAQRRKLSNGLEVFVVEHNELPVVSMNLVVRTGAAADSKNQAGLATLTAALVDEGTETRSAIDIAEELAAIGARLGTGGDWDLSGINLLTLTRHLDRALEIYADVVTNASFPESEFKLQQSQRLASLAQRKDDANAIASVVYASLLYGQNHPYGGSLMGSESSVKAIGNDDVRRFYDTYYRPNNAALIVVGNVKADAITAKLEKALSEWKAAPIPAQEITTPRPPDKSIIYLVDKPDAAQSVLTIGHVGVQRTTPDFFPLLVLNTMLGGQFTSRVNMNLREDKGYTYGARTSFDYRRGAGPFLATAGVQTAVTKEAISEFLKELNGVRGSIPITEKELEFAKQSIIRGYPRAFETPQQISNRLTDVVLYQLPDNYFNNFIPSVRRVSLEDVKRVANRYLDPMRMAILVVGDRKVIEANLRSLPEVGVSITLLDTEGRPVERTSRQE